MIQLKGFVEESKKGEIKKLPTLPFLFVFLKLKKEEWVLKVKTSLYFL
jgi:hypothetical protein